MVTPPYIDAGTGKLVVTFAVPVMDNGELKGICGVKCRGQRGQKRQYHSPTRKASECWLTIWYYHAHPDAKLALTLQFAGGSVDLPRLFAAGAPQISF